MSVTSDSGWLVLAVLEGLGAIVVVLVVAAVLVWVRGNARLRRREEQQRRWEPTLLDLTCGDDEADRLRAETRLARMLPEGDRDAFGEFVLEYLEDLRGEDADRLRDLLRSLDYENRALRALRSRNPWRRATAARLLGELRSEAGIGPLVDAVGSHDGSVSFVAAVALVKIGAPAGLEAVAEALGTREDWSEGQVKELLPGGGERLARLLLGVVERDDLSPARLKVVVELVGSLAYLPAVERLVALLETNPPLEVRISLIRALGRLEVPEAVDPALLGLRDSNWVVRSQSALALGRVGDPAALDPLRRALDDSEYWVRFNAALALRELGADGRAALRERAAAGGPVGVLAAEVLEERRAA